MHEGKGYSHPLCQEWLFARQNFLIQSNISTINTSIDNSTIPWGTQVFRNGKEFLLHQWHPSCCSSRGHPFRGMHIAAAKLWPISIPLYSPQVCRLSWRYRIIVRFPFTNASMCLSQLILPVRFPPIPRCSRQKKNLKIPMALSEAVNRR